MASGKKTGGRNFKPGKSGNPNGRPKLPEDLKQARNLDRIEFARILSNFLRMTKDQVAKRIQEPEASSLEIILGTVIWKAAQKGDHQRLSFLLDRMIGKVPSQVHLDTPNPLAVSHQAIFQLLQDLKKDEDKD